MPKPITKTSHRSINNQAPILEPELNFENPRNTKQ